MKPSSRISRFTILTTLLLSSMNAASSRENFGLSCGMYKGTYTMRSRVGLRFENSTMPGTSTRVSLMFTQK